MSTTSQDLKNLARTAGQSVGIAAQALDDLLGDMFPGSQERAGRQQLEEQRMNIARAVANFTAQLRDANAAKEAAETGLSNDSATFALHERNVKARADSSNPEARILSETALENLANSISKNKADLVKANGRVANFKNLLEIAEQRLAEVQQSIESFESAVQAGHEAEQEAQMRLESVRLAEGLKTGEGAARVVTRAQERAQAAQREADAVTLVANASKPKVDQELAAFRAEASSAPQSAADRIKAMLG